MSRPSLPRLVKKWQRILSLQDWDITASYRKKLSEVGNLGECEVTATLRAADMLILDPAAKRHDVELTVVHEMVHVSTWWTNINGSTSHRNVIGEQHIEALAKALVDLDRR